MLNLMVFQGMAVLFKHILALYIINFQVVEIIGGEKRYVCPPPNIFMGGGGTALPAPPPPPRIDASDQMNLDFWLWKFIYLSTNDSNSLVSPKILDSIL